MENNGNRPSNDSSRHFELTECEFHDTRLARIMLEMSNEIRYLTGKIQSMETIMYEWINVQKDCIISLNKPDIVVKTRSTQWSPQEPYRQELTYAEALKIPVPNTISSAKVKDSKLNDKPDEGNTSSRKSTGTTLPSKDGRQNDVIDEISNERSFFKNKKVLIAEASKSDIQIEHIYSNSRNLFDSDDLPSPNNDKNHATRGKDIQAEARSIKRSERENDVTAAAKRGTLKDKVGLGKIGLSRKNGRQKANDGQENFGPDRTVKNERFQSQNREDELRREHDLPKVEIYHDSILKYVDGDRLGKAYGCSVKKEAAYLLDEVNDKLINKDSCEKVDAVVIHCGINEFKLSHPKKAAEKLIKTVKEFKKARPNTKIVVSGIAPTKSSDLNKKKNFFNSTITSGLFEENEVYVIVNENLKPEDLYDTVHPSRYRGSSKLATNIGRVIRNLFWVEAEKTKRKRQQEWWESNVMSY